MNNHSINHHRRSIRLKEYDYSQEGGYYVTICAHNKECIFGAIVGGKMMLNNFGNIAREEWLKTPAIRPTVILSEFVVMPNHSHGIILLTDIDRRGTKGRDVVGAYSNTPQKHLDYRVRKKGANINSPLRSPSQTIGAIVRGFKSAATKRINQLRNTPRFPVWQRSYWEHVIRDGDDLMRINEYIVNNVLQWQYDEENPEHR